VRVVWNSEGYYSIVVVDLWLKKGEIEVEMRETER